MSENVDPVTFEVIKHRLWQINDEQGTTIRTISSSPIVTEVNDFNVGLFTADGDIVSVGPYVVHHVTTMDDMISNVKQRASSIEKGDVFLCNDPDLGALHHNDVAIMAPVFRNDELVAWFSNTLHQVDVGGIDVGSFCIHARDTFDEPPRFFLKIIDGGEWADEVEYTYLKASRFPDRLELDLRAQTAALNVAKSRFHELCEEYDVETVTNVMHRSIDYAEDELRDLLADLPDGEWSATGYMDDDGHTERIYEVQLTLRKEGEHLHFDYSGTDEQAIGGLNATEAACYAGTTAPIYAFLCDGDIDWNSAVKRLVSVEAPPGTVVNAQFPAGVSISSIGFTRLAQQVSCKVVAEMMLESDEHRDRACASWLASWCGPSLTGTNADGERFQASLSEGKGGGSAARTFADGFEHAGSLSASRSMLSNVEEYERKYPLTYLFRRQLPDSGGAGRYRGGVSMLTAITPEDTQECRAINKTFGSDHSPAYGLAGGYPGGGAQVCTIEHDLPTAFEEGHIPQSLEEFDEVTFHRPKEEIDINSDQAVVFYQPGGGGYQDPLNRDLQAIEKDVSTGRVSKEEARRMYGVVFASNDGPEIDSQATTEQREERRRERLEEATPVSDSEQATLPTISCPGCDHPSETVLSRIRELGEAGRWVARRHDGESPNFLLRESICGDCGTLLDVRQVYPRSAIE